MLLLGFFQASADSSFSICPAPTWYLFSPFPPHPPRYPEFIAPRLRGYARSFPLRRIVTGFEFHRTHLFYVELFPHGFFLLPILWIGSLCRSQSILSANARAQHRLQRLRWMQHVWAAIAVCFDYHLIAWWVQIQGLEQPCCLSAGDVSSQTRGELCVRSPFVVAAPC